jgi:cysteine desulfurase/selenocysteine lyase
MRHLQNGRLTSIMTTLMNESAMDNTTKANALDVSAVRADFPILETKVYGKPLVYLDNGATTHKPQCVINRISQFYGQEYGTVRRGVYALSEGATEAFQNTRDTVAAFLNAPSSDEIIFTRGSTEAINLVAHSYGHTYLNAGDEILISAMEHHANIVPWQQIAQLKGAVIKVIPMNDRGELDMTAYESLLNNKTKMVAVNHVSNSLGTINPVAEMITKAHAVGAAVLVDGAQSAPHMAVDVQALDADFYCFSGHKVYGPTGIGALYGKRQWLEAMVPYQTGGDMIDKVSFEETTFTGIPHKFEAGTPAIAQVVGLGTALNYLTQLGLPAIAAHEADLLAYATKQMQSIDGLGIIGTARHKASLISFMVEGAHPLDMGTLLDHEGVAIRTGHHCAQPVMRHFNVSATARASFGIYNTRNEVDTFVAALTKVLGLLR